MAKTIGFIAHHPPGFPAALDLDRAVQPSQRGLYVEPSRSETTYRRPARGGPAQESRRRPITSRRFTSWIGMGREIPHRNNRIARQGRGGVTGDPHVDLVIGAHDGQTAVNAYGLDDSFLVDSELVLFAEDGAVRYEVVPVPPYQKRYRKDDLIAPGEVPDKELSLAFLDDSVAGRILVSEGWNRYAWVEDIAVDARRRRAGVGRALMDRAVDWAVERGLPGIRLETQNNNVPACKFYESYGFHLGGFDRGLYRGLDGATTEIALFWCLPLRAAAPHGQTRAT
jgi:ribosomal protein S18 acetylase RimI-like enzyme